MQPAAKKNLSLTGCASYAIILGSQTSVGPHTLLFQSLLKEFARTVHSRQSSQNLARGLIRVAERAYSLRDMKTVKEAGQVLMYLPVTGVQDIASFYQALVIKREGQTNRAKAILEDVADNAPSVFRARAIQALGALQYDIGKPDEALKYHIEALRALSIFKSRDPLTTLLIHLEISHIQSFEKNHQAALSTLERIYPVVKIVAEHNPAYFYFYHNELAVELSEVNRIEEAKAASAIALSSRVAEAYPNWFETQDDINAKSQAKAKSQAAASSHAQAAIERAFRPEPSSKTEHKQKRAFTFSLLARKADYGQRPVSIIAPTVIIYARIISLITQRIHRRPRPRGPPALR
jgi:tetratricopeptide (TPR) repeat protein